MNGTKYALFPRSIGGVYVTAIALAKYHGVSLSECKVFSQDLLASMSEREKKKKLDGLIKLEVPEDFEIE